MKTVNKYDKYKDSGIEWIGEIPQDWNIYKIKNLAEISGRIGFKGYTIDDLVDSDTIGAAIVLGGTNIMKEGYISYNKLTYISEYKYLESPEIMLYGGEILITKVGAGTGDNAIYNYYTERVTINPNVMLCKPNNNIINSNYLNYYLLSPLTKTEILIEANKSGAQPAINQQYIKNLFITCPPELEQQQIADYLDKKCGEIDRVVETQKDIIEKLKEYKQSVITEAVTKGLDKSLPLKDSGIEWIGEIPKHWSLRRLKTTLNLRNEKVEYNGKKYIGLENITSNSGQYNLSDENIIDGISNKFYSGDVLFGKLRPYLAKATIVDFDGLCSSEFLVMQNYKGNNKFLLKILLSYWFIDIVNSSTYGAKMPRASWKFISNMVIHFLISMNRNKSQIILTKNAPK